MDEHDAYSRKIGLYESTQTASEQNNDGETIIFREGETMNEEKDFEMKEEMEFDMDEEMKDDFSETLFGAADACLDDAAKQAEFLRGKIQEIFSGLKGKAEKMLENTEQFEKFLERVEDKLQKLPGYGSKLVYVPQLILLLIDYVKGNYKEITKAEIITIVAALMYVLLPVDALPDLVPGLGFLDDAAVMIWLFSLINDDIETYMQWRQKNAEACTAEAAKDAEAACEE